MPESRSAMVCCGNISLPRTLCLHVKENHKRTLKLATVENKRTLINFLKTNGKSSAKHILLPPQ